MEFGMTASRKVKPTSKVSISLSEFLFCVYTFDIISRENTLVDIYSAWV